MKILIVYAHPEPTSFNDALKEIAINVFKQNQHEVQLSDLYAMHFNPVADWGDFMEISPLLPRQYGVVQREAYLKDKLASDIKKEQEKLSWCHLVIFQFPLWWFGPPAILKGWLDRVIAAGFAYDKEKWFDTGLLKSRRALLSITTQSPSSAYQENGIHGDIEQYIKPIKHTLRFAGINPDKQFIAYGVMDIQEQTRQRYLEKYRSYLLSLSEA